ncbi:MAG TPA: FAD-dependent oxidoreductase [Terriglobales bacterium]|jgi:monomeric sarcosine oxidase|nr:FAD-dependent oxidoreductase [Terriglobales bacterium]
MPSKPHIVVVGAGAFGGWTALYLLRRGARVTLIDAWGAGNARSSSGGDTRIMRRTYGPDQPYPRMASRAMQLWKEHDERWNCRLFHQTGVLWMATAGDDQYERASLPSLREAGIRFEELSSVEMSKRWPQINFQDVRWAIYEPDGGFLCARNACQAVVNGFVAEGGEFRLAAVVPGKSESEYEDGLTLSDGSKLVADQYVFACGPWLGKLFPETIGELIRPTKQEVFFLGTPAGDDRFSEAKLPVWADHRDRFIYGIPANDGRGFKIADDTRGPAFDPTSGERTASAETLEMVREYLAFRFPAMKGAPLVETQVCQYENTPDDNFIIDQHPQTENVWIVGGGSGHGFKHGPAIGEMVAELVMEGKDTDAMFRLGRFRK